jgi:hypothetical protein
MRGPGRLLQLESKRDVNLHHLHLRDLWLHRMYGASKHKVISVQTEHHHVPVRHPGITIKATINQDILKRTPDAKFPVSFIYIQAKQNYKKQQFHSVRCTTYSMDRCWFLQAEVSVQPREVNVESEAKKWHCRRLSAQVIQFSPANLDTHLSLALRWGNPQPTSRLHCLIMGKVYNSDPGRLIKISFNYSVNCWSIFIKLDNTGLCMLWRIITQWNQMLVIKRFTAPLWITLNLGSDTKFTHLCTGRILMVF